MARYESQRKQFEDRGAGVAFIAGQSEGGLLGAGRYLRKSALAFPYLLDRDRAVIKAYGIYRPIGLDGVRTAHPSTFLLDQAGRIRWIYVGRDQRDRPEPHEVLEQIDSLGT